MAKPIRRLWPLLLLLAGCPKPPIGPGNGHTDLTSELITGSDQIKVEVLAKDVNANKGWPGLTGIAAGPNGTVYVIDRGTNRILQFAPDGTSSVLAGSKAGELDGKDGKGTEAIFAAPISLARDAQGNLWTVEAFGKFLVRRISPDGTVTTVVHRDAMPEPNGYTEQARVVADRTGAIYLYEKGNSQQTIWRVEPQGSLRKVWGISSSTDEPLAGFYDVAAAPTEGLWDLSRERKLQSISDTGATATIRTFAPQSDAASTLMGVPMALNADTKGNAYVLGRRSIDHGTWQAQTPSWFVQKVDPMGTITPVLTCRYTALDPEPFPGIRIATSVAPPEWLRPLTFTIGDDGKLYVADSIQNRVLRVTVTAVGSAGT